MMTEEHVNVVAGMKAENYFSSIMNQKGLPHTLIDDWYDFEVCGQKVEVKSCRISTKDGEVFRPGRFDFTCKFNREKQYNENIWICFIVRHYDQFIILGFCNNHQIWKSIKHIQIIFFLTRMFRI